MQLNPYVFFAGNCEEAFHFYKECLNGKIEALNYYEGSPMPVGDDDKGKVLHAVLRFGDNQLMGADMTGTRLVENASRISMSINFEDPDLMESTFGKLADGGQVTMPLQDTFWGARFGMFTDRFGIGWMFNCEWKK